MAIDRFEKLRVYQRALDQAMRIFELSHSWPQDERFALTGQIRRSSRSVCANVAEAWCKRQFERHFVSKLSDSHAEAAETRVWLQFAFRCGYLLEEDFDQIDSEYDAIIGGLVKMLGAPEKWCGPSRVVREDEVDYDTAP
ncbi:MAG TPA: four helix bundle protein [Rhodothermales bacterium]|nr:four helix bundle protein [Rhodothermales bacterium]